jgi:hypothetical protein
MIYTYICKVKTDFQEPVKLKLIFKSNFKVKTDFQMQL